MTKTVYWIVSVVVLAFAIAGATFLFQPPQPGNVEIQVLEDFFRNQYVIAALIGIILGGLLGWLASRRTLHRPRERGIDFASRVTSKGILSGAGCAFVAAIATIAYAALTELGPLAPLEKVLLIALSGLFTVVIAIAFSAGCIAYAIATRVSRWGGQYALIRTF